MQHGRPGQHLRAQPRDLLVVVPADQRLERGQHLPRRMLADAHNLRPQQLPVRRSGGGHEQPLGEQVELHRQDPVELLAALGRGDEGVTIGERAQQPQHARDDLGIGQARHAAGQQAHPGVKVRLGNVTERRHAAALDLAGQERDVGAPAFVARQPARIGDAEHLAHRVVAAQRRPEFVAARAAEVTETEIEGAAERRRRALAVTEPRLAAGDAVGDLAGEDGLREPPSPGAKVQDPLVGGPRAEVVAQFGTRLGEPVPVAAVHRVALHHLRPQRGSGRPLGRVALRFRCCHHPQVSGRIRHGFLFTASGLPASGRRRCYDVAEKLRPDRPLPPCWISKPASMFSSHQRRLTRLLRSASWMNGFSRRLLTPSRGWTRRNWM